MALVLHPTGPDFELYQVSDLTECKLEESKVRINSIDCADQIAADENILFSLPHALDNNLFKGIPPCRGGRTLGMLALAAKRQLETDALCLWDGADFHEDDGRKFGLRS